MLVILSLWCRGLAFSGPAPTLFLRRHLHTTPPLRHPDHPDLQFARELRSGVPVEKYGRRNCLWSRRTGGPRLSGRTRGEPEWPSTPGSAP
jgi:hypothetical protein